MSDGQTSKRSFDIGQEKDLIALLREVRHSTLSPQEKDDVRDAVFAVSNKKNDILLRGLQSTLEKINIAITHSPTSQTGDSESIATTDKVAEAIKDTTAAHAAVSVQKITTLGRTRRPVLFSGVKAGTPSQEHPKPPVDTHSLNKEQSAVEEAATQFDTTEVSGASTLPEKDTVTQSSTPTPTVEQVHQNTIPPQKSEDTPSRVVGMTSEEAMERIKTIKQKVNSAVGNPVNLISKNEVIGKEYMATLLEAMRVATADGDVVSVMQKLEGVYEKVQKVLESNEEIKKEETLKEATSPSPVRSVEHKDTKVAVAVQETPVQNTSKAVTAPQTPSSERVDEPVVKPAAPVASPEASLATNDSVETVLAAADTALSSAKKADSLTQGDADQSSISTPKNAVLPSSPVSPTEAKGTAVPLTKITTPSAVSNTQFQAVTAQPSAIEKQRQVFDQYKQQQKEFVEKNPLHAPAVEEGLGILLGEWSIFRKSGLLGTGPKSKEHPLYKRIKDLKMNLIISGRFEGATPEVRQSIVDYMNGWRYEHGIVHEMDETFETYLRRVIATILRKQDGTT